MEMEALSKRMQRLNMEEKVVTLLNELWGKMCVNTTVRRHVEFTCEDHGMEFSVGELMVATFYVMNEKKFWSKLHYVFKLQVQSVLHCLESIIYHQFVSDWIMDPFIPWYWKRHAREAHFWTVKRNFVCLQIFIVI